MFTEDAFHLRLLSYTYFFVTRVEEEREGDAERLTTGVSGADG